MSLQTPPADSSRGPKLGIYSSGWSAPGAVAFGASDFWRLAVPGRELAKNGWSLIAAVEIQSAADGTLILKDEDGVLHDDCEVILWQRWMGKGAADAILRARSVGQAVVNDVDDYYWAFPRSNTARAFTDPKRNPDYNREIYREVIRASTMVTVSTPFLAKALSRWGPPVRVVRNYVPLDQWDASPPGEHVGWVGVIGWRDADMQIVKESVIPWLRERNLPFYHGGHLDRAPIRDLIGYDDLVLGPATDLPRYPKLWDPLGVALIPLVSSTFNDSKSFVKGLEACSRGIPFIASYHPEYEILGSKRMVRRSWEWAKHLDELSDPAVRVAEGKANRSIAEKWSIERNWQEWDRTLRDAISLTSEAVRLLPAWL